MNQTKAFKASEIYPPFLAKLEQLVAACKARGAEYWATSGYRSWEEQNKLYALGRTAKNVDTTSSNPMGGRVTNAKGGQSNHNYSIATDFALDKDTERAGLQPDWNLEAYRVLAEEAKKLGLEAGFYWTKIKDGPHVQLPLSKQGITLAQMAAWYKHGGIPEIWANLDKYNW